MNWRIVAALVFGCFAASGAGQAQATALTLYNTGVTGPNNPDGTNGTQITSNDTVDSHYTVAGPNAGSTVYVVTDQPAYSANSDSSSFVNDTGSGQNGEPVGDYLYSTTFNIPANLNPATATISGEFSVDNEMDNILLNGASIGDGYPYAIGTGPGGFSSFTTFTIPAGSNFVTGTNTLTFEVYNAGTAANPTAVNISLLEGTVAAAVPEPSTLALFGMSVLGMFYFARPRRGR
ncbi:MAG TPA: PEP-CTERM sorting domain-containing protein [Pirellulales bacterium]|nr:PEP-CTERM sorting domain-containing protein [Pirellulales bacterium]